MTKAAIDVRTTVITEDAKPRTGRTRRARLPFPSMDRARDEPAPAAPPGDGDRGGRFMPVVTIALAVLAVASVVTAGAYGIAWFRAANDPAQEAAMVREEVLRDARQVILNLEAIDYETLDADLARWESSVTGPLLEDFRAGRDRYAEQVRAGQAKAEATIVDAAVLELNPTAGTAEVLIFVNLVTTEHKDGKETGRAEKRQRLKLEMTRTDDGWKASQAGPVGAR
jgi:Mce-associated membrane protein